MVAMIKTISYIFLIINYIAVATAETIVRPKYDAEVVENLDINHILQELFKKNGENVEEYLDLSQFPPITNEIPSGPGLNVLPNSFDILSSQLPKELGTTPGIIRQNGYPCEEHFVTTRDGYILGLHRIPRSPHIRRRHRRAPVLLLHGMLDSSSAWVLAGRERGLAFILSDRGHDVWLGNFRGNRYSRNHTILHPDESSTRRPFWNFSWHEMGTEDIPAMIDYILAQDRRTNRLHYIGHSQGTTAFFVMASERPEYNNRVFAMHALAPVAFMNNMKGIAARALLKLFTNTQAFLSLIEKFELLADNSIVNVLAQRLCANTAISKEVCSNIMFLFYGHDSKLFDTNLLPIVLKNTPAGAAVKQSIHFGQNLESKQFRQFDYGTLGNRRIYGSKTPPQYRLQNVRCPVNLAYGLNDLVAAAVDVQRLNKSLPNVISLYEVPHTFFNHLDFIWGLEAPRLVYDHCIGLLDRAERGEFD